jgi:hypothetical protein
MSTSKNTALKSAIAQDRRIVALSERWVFIGDYHAAENGKPAYLTDASCIRAWGTKAGLGEIALRGPTKETVLDPSGTVVLEQGSVLFCLLCTFS